jgi:hypothetical protein
MHFISSSGTLGSTTTQVDFSSIPQTFTHLQLRCFFKSAYASGEGGLYITPWFNNTGGGSGRYHHLYGTGSSIGASNGSFYYTGVSSPINSSTTNIFASAIVDILDYTDTNKIKPLQTLGGYDSNGGGLVAIGSMMRFDATTAINGFRIDDSGGGGWLAGSRFDLYGITINPTATGV